MNAQLYYTLKTLKKRCLVNVVSLKYFILEWRNFVRSQKDEKASIQRDILLLAHTVEKGMSLRNVKKGYGLEKANKLLHMLDIAYSKGIERDDYSFMEGCAVLNAYINYQTNAMGIEFIQDIKDRYNMFLQKYQIKSEDIQCRAGYDEHTTEDLTFDNIDVFDELLKKRHSIRSFSKNSFVTQEELNEITRMVATAPSACNRQPTKFYYSFDKAVIAQIAEFVPGNKGFADEPTNFLVVTSSRSMFGSGESCQWYVNGGIYLGYLSLALAASNIGSCIFQWTINRKGENEIKQILNIGKNECIIAVVGIGKYDEEFKCVVAQRKY